LQLKDSALCGESFQTGPEGGGSESQSIRLSTCRSSYLDMCHLLCCMGFRDNGGWAPYLLKGQAVNSILTKTSTGSYFC